MRSISATDDTLALPESVSPSSVTDSDAVDVTAGISSCAHEIRSSSGETMDADAERVSTPSVMAASAVIADTAV
jgi:hypothetical protein